MCQKAGQKVEGVAPVQQRQRDPGREARRSDQGKADKEPRQQDPGEMRHRSERESITGSRSGEPPASAFKIRGREIPEELEREKAGGVLKIY